MRRPVEEKSGSTETWIGAGVEAGDGVAVTVPQVNQIRAYQMVYQRHKAFPVLRHALCPVLTAQTQYNLANARSYFAEHLAVGDYYSEGEQVLGEWVGLASERLGLGKTVAAEAFLRLCENRHPTLNESFTPRTNTTRSTEEGSKANRRVFFDFTFSPPKSVSIAALIGEDPRIRQAHARAVRAAFSELEAFAGVRVRKDGALGSRRTGNLVAALFTHDTSRALDPHLHTHGVVFNGSWDPVEKRWKALENHDLLKARKFAEFAYYHELARDLVQMGYSLRNRPRGDFELEGISDELCTRFSKRHAQIDQALAKLLQDKPELASKDLLALRRRLATAERARKQHDLSSDQLQRLWKAQVSGEEVAALRTLAKAPSLPATAHSLAEAVSWAEEHVFDRASVVSEHQIWKEALGRARGADFSLGNLRELTATRPYVRHPDHPGEVTLPEVVEREQAIIRIAFTGRGAYHPLVRTPGPADPRLDEDQRTALTRLLGSPHAVTVFRGGAGTGKSFVLRQLVDHLTVAGKVPIVLAPQRQQVVEMEQAGFPVPATVAEFLTRAEVPNHAVLLVDEAGQIGGRQMLDLLRLAAHHNARVVLSGDTRQHGPVEASDALVAIERHAGIEPIELRRIRRQDPALASTKAEKAFIRGYRAAVEAAAKGNLRASYDGLAKLGAIVRCDPEEQATALAREYVRLSETGATTVVVSQTWAEVHRVNDRIRDALKSKGLLGPSDTSVLALDRQDLTSAQKRDPRFYHDSSVVVFNRPIRNAAAGATGKVAAFLPGAVLVETSGRLVRVPHAALDHLTICSPREIPLSPGDRLQLKANRTLPPGKRVNNGELVTVQAIDEEGNVRLADGRVLDPTYREFLPGYAVTSYGSQGKTVDHVLLSDAGSKAATHAEQWYVSISRGRRGVRIFTPDPDQLRENVLRSGHRPLAVEMAPGPSHSRPPLGRWNAVKHRLTRFGETAVRHLAALRFFQPKHLNPNHHDYASKRSRGLGH